mmetsp:Transcript_44082/g.72864  ORF Transcript_44082/g.72864 Transcript_44082/m.72864 type:complete len:261 (+) Transcript_44082:269-1051(+)
MCDFSDFKSPINASTLMSNENNLSASDTDSSLANDFAFSNSAVAAVAAVAAALLLRRPRFSSGSTLSLRRNASISLRISTLSAQSTTVNLRSSTNIKHSRSSLSQVRLSPSSTQNMDARIKRCNSAIHGQCCAVASLNQNSVISRCCVTKRENICVTTSLLSSSLLPPPLPAASSFWRFCLRLCFLSLRPNKCGCACPAKPSSVRFTIFLTRFAICNGSSLVLDHAAFTSPNATHNTLNASTCNHTFCAVVVIVVDKGHS